LSPNIISEKKQHIRERILALRQSQSPDVVQEAGLAVAQQVRDHEATRRARKVCLYASTGKEIPTWDLLSQLVEDGKTVSVPDWEGWTQGSGIRIAVVRGPEDLMTEGRIVPQPRVTVEDIISPDEIDLFIIPGVAFDQSGNRLGMGGGYFDRLLALASSKATLLGLAFGFQVLAQLPAEPHDIPVHHVVTPGSGRNFGVNQ
jgi:5-formyltetrahydrofolate cyclo-ligase